MKKVAGERFLYRRGSGGQYYFRRAVPKGMERDFDGKTSIPVALLTTDLREARRKAGKENEAFERQVDKAREASSLALGSSERVLVPSALGPTKVEVEEAVRDWLARRMERASDAAFLTPPDEAELAVLSEHERSVRSGLGVLAVAPAQTTTWIAEAIAEDHGWNVDDGAGWWRALTALVARGQIEADQWLRQDIIGDARIITDARFHPDQYRLDAEREKKHGAVPVPLDALLALCLAEKAVVASTAKVWKRHVAHFIEFLGHADASKVERTHVVAWKEKLLAEPNKAGAMLSRRTVQDSYLAGIRALFSWAAENGKIEGNPALGIKVAGKTKSAQFRDRGLTDAEASRILAATLEEDEGRLSPERVLARRWVPWICAYTGARVNEITQLRAEDVSEHNGLWTIHITPEAGSTKNGLPRTVALHSHLLEQGFLSAVNGRTGPIFYDPKLRRRGSEAHPQFKKVGEYLARWVRGTVGVVDPNVWPNHGWRHRFKTLARVVRMDAETRDYIQGHAPRTEGEGYGYMPAEVTSHEIEKLPRYQV